MFSARIELDTQNWLLSGNSWDQRCSLQDIEQRLAGGLRLTRRANFATVESSSRVSALGRGLKRGLAQMGILVSIGRPFAAELCVGHTSEKCFNTLAESDSCDSLRLWKSFAVLAEAI